MSDVKIPNEIALWITEKNWGEHHDQWHWVRRWDYWKALEADPDIPQDWKAWMTAKFQEADQKGWVRSPIQEGEVGNGEEFLFMHRAMIEVIIDDFPQHLHFFRGWNTPPTDHASDLDPVPVPSPEPTRPCAPMAREICKPMLEAIQKIEGEHESFESDDAFGLFIETNMRPTPSDPTARSSDPQTGIHNFLHGRWSGMSTDLDLGDPRFNIFNTRFWRLHGWIDHQWWLFRKNKGFDDSDSDYQTNLKHYKKMMSQAHHHHDFIPHSIKNNASPSKNAFADLVAEFK